MTRFFSLFLFLFAFCLFGRQVQQIGFSQNGFALAVDSCKAIQTDSSFFHFLSPKHLPCLIGAPMPDLNVQTINKENIQLPHPTAKIHVFFFWHLSCDPCLGLMEGLDHIKSKFEYQGVKFISFTPDDINTTIEEFYPYYTFNWPMIPNASQITKEAFAFSWGNPTIMIFDTNNKLAYIKAGAVNEPVIIQKIIEDLKLEIRHCLKK